MTDILGAIGNTSIVRLHKVVPPGAESSVLRGGPPGPHKIEGVGIGYTPPLWGPALVDDVVPVATEERWSR